MIYFPMMVALSGKKCLIIGGGKVAERKVRVMQDFAADVTVIATNVSEQIKKNDNITWSERCYTQDDIAGADVVIAATDDPVQNHVISELCKNQKIPVNAVDQVEDCTFIFPSYWKQGDVVAAFSSGGNSPVVTQYLKEKTKEVVPDLIGEIADILGSLRKRVKMNVSSEKERKACFSEIFSLAIEKNAIPSDSEIESILLKYENEEL